ncbi:MAG: cytidine deaminase [Clostridia bacterium]|nr:cytidine deaminase [Clostridia bacterium]
MIEPKRLIEAAKAAMEFAYAPYSGSRVGAAICTESGKVYTGCNVENESYGATICAERTAAVKAVSEGECRFVQLAVVSSVDRITPPCGICRQFLAEFAADMTVYLAEGDSVLTVPFDDLFPKAKLPL